MSRRPLIRKNYTGAGRLKLIFQKIVYGKRGRTLTIPAFAEETDFIPLWGNGAVQTLPESIDEERLLQLLEKNDLRGAGGGGYPAALKLRKVLAADCRAPVLIINAAECDPGLRHDGWILKNRKKEIEAVIATLTRSLKLRKVYIAAGPEYGGSGFEGAVTAEVSSGYPAGEERRMLESVLGLSPDSYRYPSDLGIWVQNVQTILQIGDILSGRRPVKYITAVNLNEARAAVVECSPDEEIGPAARRAGLGDAELFAGGGIMQAGPADAADSLSPEINLIAAGRAADFDGGKCLGCGSCSIHCPAGIDVQKTAAAVLDGVEIAAETARRCLSCGSCSYLCPAGIDLCSLIKN